MEEVTRVTGGVLPQNASLTCKEGACHVWAEAETKEQDLCACGSFPKSIGLCGWMQKWLVTSPLAHPRARGDEAAAGLLSCSTSTNGQHLSSPGRQWRGSNDWVPHAIPLNQKALVGWACNMQLQFSRTVLGCHIPACQLGGWLFFWKSDPTSALVPSVRQNDDYIMHFHVIV